MTKGFGYRVFENAGGFLTIGRMKGGESFAELKVSLTEALEERRADLFFQLEQCELNIQGVAALKEDTTPGFFRATEMRCLH